MRGSSKADDDEEPAPWLSAACMAATRGASRQGWGRIQVEGGRHRDICCLPQKVFLESSFEPETHVRPQPTEQSPLGALGVALQPQHLSQPQGRGHER